jgi:hypothetical protein
LLEPQSTALFILLMAVFCGLLVCVAIARQPAVRALAASLAFIPAMLFGVAAVNKYYDYCQTWASVAADLNAQGVSSVPQIPASASWQQLATILGKVTGSKTAAREGDRPRAPAVAPGRGGTTASFCIEIVVWTWAVTCVATWRRRL